MKGNAIENMRYGIWKIECRHTSMRIWDKAIFKKFAGLFNLILLTCKYMSHNVTLDYDMVLTIFQIK